MDRQGTPRRRADLQFPGLFASFALFCSNIMKCVQCQRDFDPRETPTLEKSHFDEDMCVSVNCPHLSLFQDSDYFIKLFSRIVSV